MLNCSSNDHNHDDDDDDDDATMKHELRMLCHLFPLGRRTPTPKINFMNI